MIAKIRSAWISGDFLRPLYTEECLETIDRWEGVLTKPSPENRRKTKIRVFRNGFIEHVLAKSHPAAPGVWAIPVAGWGLYRGFTGGYSGVTGTLTLFALGVLLWTLIEYVVHRYVFHLEQRTPGGKIRAFLMHGYHHEFPADKMRLVAPPLMSGAVAIVVITLYYPIFGPNYWLQVFAGTTLGYLAYDWSHYYAHHFNSQNRMARWLRRYHLLHHYQDDFTRYGISTPLWDLIFGTYRSPDDTAVR